MSYFSDTASERRPDAKGRYASIDRLPLVDAGGGVWLRPCAGENLLMSYARIDPNGEAAVHAHDEEQMGMILEGTCTFELDGETKELKAGDIFHAPGGVPHGVKAGSEGCVIVDVFSPPRKALVELINRRTSR